MKNKIKVREIRKIKKTSWYQVYKDDTKERLQSSLDYIIIHHSRHTLRMRVIRYIIENERG